MNSTAINRKCKVEGCERDATSSYREKDNSWSEYCAQCFADRFDAPADWEDACCFACGYFAEKRECKRQMEIDGSDCYGCMRLAICRKCGLAVAKDDPACPDFDMRVPRGEK